MRAKSTTVLSLVAVLGGVPLAQGQVIHATSDDALPRSDRLVIEGAGFGAAQGAGRVEIGGIVAPVSFWSNEKIRAYVPEAAPIGASSVRVFAPDPSNAVPIDVQPRLPLPGRARWRLRTDDNMLASQPAVGPDGTVYVTGLYGHLYAVAPDGGLKWIVRAFGNSSASVGADGTVYAGGGGTVRALNPDGTERWRFAGAGTLMAGPNVGPDGNIYGATGGYTGSETGAFVLSPEGELLFSYPGLNFRHAPAAWEVAFDESGSWYVCSGMGWPTQGIIGILAFDLGGGFKWQRNGLGQSRGGAAGVFVNNPQDDSITSYDPAGNLRWHVALNDLPGRSPSPPALGPDGTFYVPQPSPLWFNAIDVNGNVLWSIRPGYSTAWPTVHPDNTMVVAGGYALTYTDHAVQAFDPADGSVLWTYELPFADESYRVAQQWFGEFSHDATTIYIPTSGTEYGEAFSFLYAIDTRLVAGDVNGDGVVDFSDVLRVLAAWGPCEGACPEDLDDSRRVDFADLLIVLAGWTGA